MTRQRRNDLQECDGTAYDSPHRQGAAHSARHRDGARPPGADTVADDPVRARGPHRGETKFLARRVAVLLSDDHAERTDARGLETLHRRALAEEGCVVSKVAAGPTNGAFSRDAATPFGAPRDSASLGVDRGFLGQLENPTGNRGRRRRSVHR